MWQSVGKSLRGLIAAVFLLVGGFCALEVGLRIDRYQASCTLTASRTNANLTIEEQIVAPSLTTWTELLPLARVTQVSADLGETVQITINSLGYRGPEPVIPKPAGLIRVVCLGDETTLATEVGLDQAYPAQLQQILEAGLQTRIEVINAGIPGSCPRQAALALRHRWLALQPDLVIVHFDMSDVADDEALKRFVTLSRDDQPMAALHPSARKAGQLTGRRLCEEFLVVHHVEAFASQYWDRRTPHEADPLTDPRTRYQWTADQGPDRSAEITSAMAPLEAIRAICDRAGVKLLVSTTPKPWQVSPEASPTREARGVNGIPREACWTNPEPFRRLQTACNDWQIPSLIAWEAFREAEEPESLFLRTSPQLSPRGHTLYAELLAGAIQQGTSPEGSTQRKFETSRESPPRSLPPREIEPAQALEPLPAWPVEPLPNGDSVPVRLSPPAGRFGE